MQFTLKSPQVMQYVKLAKYFKLADHRHRHDRVQNGAIRLRNVYCASWGKDCWDFLPSVEHNWL